MHGARGRRELFAETQEEYRAWVGAFALLGACAGAAVAATDTTLSARHGEAAGSPPFQRAGTMSPLQLRLPQR